MKAEITQRPTTFDRVDRVKKAVGQEVLDHDDELWILGQPLIFVIDERTWTVPSGFTTDGASIPRFVTRCTGWAKWKTPQRLPAICHDYLYSLRGTAKGYDDRVFRALLEAEGASWLRSTAMYLAVHWFGEPAYVSDQKTGPRIYP